MIINGFLLIGCYEDIFRVCCNTYMCFAPKVFLLKLNSTCGISMCGFDFPSIWDEHEVLAFGCDIFMILIPGYLNTWMVFEFQVPFLLGVPAFEKVASCVIHFIFRRTGRHLFLTDDDEGKPPLLKRMVQDYGDLYFMYVCCFLH